MSPLFTDDDDIDTGSMGDPSLEGVGFEGWEDNDRMYLELDFAPFDDGDEDEPR
jgi:hypothetical protein